MNLKLSASLILSTILIGTFAIGIYTLNNLTFSSNLERFYKKENSESSDFEKFKNTFLVTGEKTLVTVRTKDTILNYSVLAAIDKVTKELTELPKINTASSLTNSKKLVKAPFLGYILSPALSLDSNKAIDYGKIIAQTNCIGTYVANDLKGFSIQIITDYQLENEEIVELQNSIENILRKNGFPDFYITGRLFGQNKVLSILQSELVVFMGVSFFLICLILYLLYRSFWSIVRPAIILLSSMVWTFGFMAILGKPIDVLSSIVPPILFVIGTSDVVHIYEKYRHELREKKTKIEAIKISLIKLSKATLITSVTTMIGFLSLLMSSITPIKELGIAMAAGVAIAYILTFSLFPALLVLTPKPIVSNHSAAFYPLFKRGLDLVLGHKVKVLGTFLFLTIIGCLALTQLKVDNYLTEDLPNDDNYKGGYTYLESQFSGARPLEFAISIKSENGSKTNLTSYNNLVELDKLDQHIRKTYETNATFSILEIIREIRKANSPNKHELPELTEKEYRTDISTYLTRIKKSKIVIPFLNEEAGLIRISGLAKDLGGAEIRLRNKEILQFANDSCKNLNIKVTGVANLIDDSNHNIANDMLKGLAIALLLVSILMSILYRSIKLILVALIPNILPLLMIAIVMVLLGIDIKISTALIFTLAFGIVVDDTIHFLSKLKQDLNAGLTFEDALSNTYTTTGRSIVITSVILCSGFLALSFSSFTSTHYMGMLVSLTLLFAVISDLILLPVLLQWLKGK